MSINARPRATVASRHRRAGVLWFTLAGVLPVVGLGVAYLLAHAGIPAAAILTGALFTVGAVLPLDAAVTRRREALAGEAARTVALARATDPGLCDGCAPAVPDDELLALAEAVGAVGRHSREDRDADTAALPVVTR